MRIWNVVVKWCACGNILKEKNGAGREILLRGRKEEEARTEEKEEKREMEGDARGVEKEKECQIHGLEEDEQESRSRAGKHTVAKPTAPAGLEEIPKVKLLILCVSGSHFLCNHHSDRNTKGIDSWWQTFAKLQAKKKN